MLVFYSRGLAYCGGKSGTCVRIDAFDVLSFFTDMYLAMEQARMG